MADTLFDYLERLGMLHYGSHIPGPIIREFLGIEIPVIATKATYDTLALCELDHIQKVREALLKRGMYIKAAGEDYRILLPSENYKQIRTYEESAGRKMKKAVLLAKTTPKETHTYDQSSARLQMKELARVNNRSFGRVSAAV